MNIVIVFLTIGFVTLIGYSIIRKFDLLPTDDFLLGISYGYGLGVGLVAMQLFLYSRLGIFWNRGALIFPWVIFLLIVFLTQKKNIKMPSIPKLRGIQKVLFGVIVIVICYTLLESILRPVTVWDGWAIWLLKSKIFFIDGMVNPSALSYVGAEYPLIISLFGTVLYIMLGFINDSAVLLMSFAFYLFLALAFFSVLKKHGITYALFFSFLLVATQNFVRHGGRLEAGQADLPLGYYIFTSTMLVLKYYKTQTVRVLALLSVFLGITGLIKVEGVAFTFVIVILLIFTILKKKKYKHFLVLSFWLLPILDWNTYKSFYHLTVVRQRTFEFSLYKSLHTAYVIVKELFNIKTWSLLWIVYFYILIFRQKKLDTNLFLVNIVIFVQLFFYLVSYLFFIDYSPESSLERLLIHIAPLALYAIAVYVHKIVSKHSRFLYE